MEKAYNSSLLGQEFIDGCTVLSANQPIVIKEYTGSDRCNYNAFQTAYLQFQACESAMWAEWERGKQLIPFFGDFQYVLGQS